MSASLFSVIIPTYNRAGLLAETLASVFQQRFTDFDVLVVDDGSTDDTAALLAGYGLRVRVWRQQNRGPGAARNFGCQHAQGRYLAFLDSDDLWFPWTLHVYAQVIKQANEPAFIAGKPYRFSDEDELRRVTKVPISTLLFHDYLESSEEWRWWGVSSFVIRRDFFDRVGGFTNEWVNGEDADLALRLGVSPGFVQVTNPVTFAYREHETSAMKNLASTLAGAWLQVHSEQAGTYPGGDSRDWQRRRILMRHVRPVTLGCLQQGLHREAWKLYRATFAWNAALGRAKYLAGFPLLAAMSKFRAAVPSALHPMPRGD